MSKMNAAYTTEHYFAALKLIEQLYKDGEIPAYMFRNILKDYADVVDLTLFLLPESLDVYTGVQAMQSPASIF